MKGPRYRRLISVITAASLFGCQGSSPPDPAGETLPGARPSTKPAADPDGSPVVTVTPKAAAMINQLVAELPKGSKLYLRVRVVPGGTQGFIHKIDLDPNVTAEDHVWESGGVGVVAFKRQVEMLRGTQVDFGVEDGKQGFKVDNPNFQGETAKKWLPVLEREKDVK